MAVETTFISLEPVSVKITELLPVKLPSTKTPVSVPSEELNLLTPTDVEAEKEPDVAEYETDEALAATAPKREATISSDVQNIFILWETFSFELHTLSK